MKSDRKKPGRREAVIDVVQLEKLAALACTIEQAASVLDVSKRTLLRRLREPKYKRIWEDGLNKGNVSLRRLQWTKALANTPASVAMVIHLSKHRLGETDKSLVEMTGKDGGPIQTVDWSQLSHDDLIKKAVEIGLPKKIFKD